MNLQANTSINSTTSCISNGAAKTVFTFVDREKTAQAHQVNPTEAALAQLYAHIQSLPESSKKRKLIKQFNKENGHGTPSVQRYAHGNTRTKSLGDSIKVIYIIFFINTNISIKIYLSFFRNIFLIKL